MQSLITLLIGCFAYIDTKECLEETNPIGVCTKGYLEEMRSFLNRNHPMT
jgi:hypothetical protein